ARSISCACRSVIVLVLGGPPGCTLFPYTTLFRSASGTELIVGRIGAADGDAAHADGLSCADILIGETGAGISIGQAVTGHPIIREGDRGAGAAIVGLVVAGGTDGQRAHGDIGRGGGAGGSQLIVAGVGTT